MKLNRAAAVLVLLVLGMALSGCYTKFASPSRDVLPEKKTTQGKQELDTIVTREREICVWERDMFGYPELRCYKTNYSWNWYDFNNTPWWYRDDPHWYDHRRCPPYYYYDPSSGTCRYGGSDYAPPSNGGGENEKLPSKRRSQSRSEEIPAPEPKKARSSSESKPVFDSAENKPLSPSVKPQSDSSELSKESNPEPKKRKSIKSKMGITDSLSDTLPKGKSKPRRKSRGF
ncbi:MAG: hypothetical protein ACLFQB_03850 [Chitinispirillaceae bacterium]